MSIKTKIGSKFRLWHKQCFWAGEEQVYILLLLVNYLDTPCTWRRVGLHPPQVGQLSRDISVPGGEQVYILKLVNYLATPCIWRRVGLHPPQVGQLSRCTMYLEERRFTSTSRWSIIQMHPVPGGKQVYILLKLFNYLDAPCTRRREGLHPPHVGRLSRYTLYPEERRFTSFSIWSIIQMHPVPGGEQVYILLKLVNYLDAPCTWRRVGLHPPQVGQLSRCTLYLRRNINLSKGTLYLEERRFTSTSSWSIIQIHPVPGGEQVYILL